MKIDELERNIIIEDRYQDTHNDSEIEKQTSYGSKDQSISNPKKKTNIRGGWPHFPKLLGGSPNSSEGNIEHKKRGREGEEKLMIQCYILVMRGIVETQRAFN